MDKLDVRLLEMLNRDARKSYRKLAKDLGVSIGTVSDRIRRLEEQKVIRGYLPDVEERSLGFELFAIIGVKIGGGKLMEVQERIAKDRRIYGVYDVTGQWDSILLARFKNTRELDTFLKKELLSLKEVESTYTQVVLNKVKEDRRVHPSPGG